MKNHLEERLSMAVSKRVRAVGSISNELLKKSREAALAAVQIFNNPSITFKSEIFIVLMVISWTYLMHAHFRKIGIDYRYFKTGAKRKKYEKTAKGAIKYWELERCLYEPACPLEDLVKKNLKFLIGLRHEIEHQMTSKLDSHLSARFQACCLNYNESVKKLFGPEFGIDKHLSFSLQFSSIGREQVDTLTAASGFPQNISSYIKTFDDSLSESEYNDSRYAYRIFFVPKTANRKGQADQVVEFIRSDSDLAKDVNKSYAVIKETEKAKFLPKQVLEKMKLKGFTNFKMHHHTELWKTLDAKNLSKGLGVNVVNVWYWYEPWIAIVEKHCAQNLKVYK